MKIKKEKRIVEYKKYITKDGMEFNDYESAERHEVLLAGEDVFGVTERDIMCQDFVYVIVRGAKDVITFKEFAEACDVACFIDDEYGRGDLHYPAVFCYTPKGYFRKVDVDEYERAKRIVSLFETLQSE